MTRHNRKTIIIVEMAHKKTCSP